MGILLPIVGVALVLAGLAITFVTLGLPEAGESEIHLGEHYSVKSTHVGFAFAGSGVVLLVLVWIGGGLPGSSDGSDEPSAGAIPQATPMATVTVTAPGAPGSSEAPGTQSGPSSGSSIPASSPAVSSEGPPWTGESEGLQLFVVAAEPRPQLGGRLELTVRLENGSKHNLGVPASGFLVVDPVTQFSYGADTENSTLPFEDGDDSVLGCCDEGPFSTGTTRAGTVVLDRPLDQPAVSLLVRFTVAHSNDDSYYNARHFTVSTMIVVPSE